MGTVLGISESREPERQPETGLVLLEEPLLNVAQAASLLNVRESWVRAAARAGWLPCVRVGRHLRFSREQLQRWLGEQYASTPASRRSAAPAGAVQECKRTWEEEMSSSYRDRAIAGSGNVRGEPSVLDGLLGGRSHADKEADADAFRNLLVFGALGVVAAVASLRWLFLAVGLRFDWWAAPPFVPLLLWLLVCGGARQVIRPRGLAELRWWKRVLAAALVAGAVWLLWPLWADPVAQAWHHAHGGWRSLQHGGLRYPLAAVLDAAPAWLGVVAFLLLALGMTAPPRGRTHEEAEPPRIEALPAPAWRRPGRAPGQGEDGPWVP